MENTPKPRKVIRISRTKLIISIVVLVVIGIVAVIASNRNNYRGGMIMGITGGGSGMMEGGSVDMASIPSVDFGDDYGAARYPSPYPNNSPDITDTREFLKVSYSAQIQTRDVADKVKDVKNAVRDAEGRIDNFSSSEKYGYVSFVVSKDKFDQFKDEVEALTHKKMYTENVSSQNLLGQKQGIEQQGESIATRLAQLEKQKKDMDTQHASRAASLQSDLVGVRAQISAVVKKWEDSNSSSERAQLKKEESDLRQREASLSSSLSQENKTYTTNSNSLVAQIAQQKQNQDGNIKQDIQFGNNIETVTGSVNVNWVSYWEMAKIFSPVHPAIIIIILALGLLYFLNRKAYLPKIEIA